jgi:hypothetical protein
MINILNRDYKRTATLSLSKDVPVHDRGEA